MVSISITVLKALKESEAAGQRKFPAASVKTNKSNYHNQIQESISPIHERLGKQAEKTIRNKFMLHFKKEKLFLVTLLQKR